jgi:hypothetical protein
MMPRRCFPTLRPLAIVRTALAALVTALALAGHSTPLQAQPLFKSDSLLDITITANMRDLLRERDSTKLRWFGAEFTYADGTGTSTVPVELRARGHFRRQRGNCDFPPIMVKLPKDDAKGTLLQGNPRVKLATPCRPNNAEYQQHILVEYGAYKAYQVLHTAAPRTRLARITYRDSSERTKPVTVLAFFIELDEEVAKEVSVTLRDNMKGARFRDVDSETLQSLSLFEFMVGNPDWSLGALHNIYLLQDSVGVVTPVAYDWDWSGLVNTRYSFPDASLPIKSVTQRHYMGPCHTLQEWAPMLARYRERKPALDAVWGTIPELSPARRTQAERYLDGFWKIIDSERDFRGTVMRTCRPEGN